MDPGVPISHYKGVMLCDRPPVETVADFARSSDPPFVSRVVPPEPLGWNPTKKIPAQTSDAGQQRIRDSVLSKHKRWLHELAEYKKQIHREEAEGRQFAEEKKKRFVEYSRKLRDIIRQSRHLRHEDVTSADHLERQDVDAAELMDQVYEQFGENSFAADLVKEVVGDVTAIPKKRKKHRKEKPAWALTQQAMEAKEQAEADNLVQFAEGLDFEQFMSDLEVREKLRELQQRVKTIDKQRGGEDMPSASESEPESESDAGEGSTVTGEDDDHSSAGLKTNPRTGSQALPTAEMVRKREDSGTEADRREAGWTPYLNKKDPPDLSRAERVLKSSRMLRNTHSAASIKNILDDIQQGKRTAAHPSIQEEPEILSIEETSKAITGIPVQLSVTDNRASRVEAQQQRRKSDVSNLPFLHRHPAV